MSLEDFEQLLKTQNDCCEICKIHKTDYNQSFSLDHSHSSNKARGILCDNCNLALGHLKDDEKLIFYNPLGENNASNIKY